MSAQSPEEASLGFTQAQDLQFLTVKKAADALNLPYFKLRNAINLGLIPTYRLANTRRYVRLRDIIKCIEENASRPGA